MTSTRRELDPELTILGGRDLVGLVGRLARERSWEALTTLFEAIAARDGIAYVALAELDTATRLLVDALAEIPPPKRPNGLLADELRALRIGAAEALLSRCSRPPMGEVERRVLRRAAALLDEGGDHRRAALAYEDLSDDVRAATAWGALGDLERMEAALAREERRDATRRAAVDAMRDFDALLTGGERRRAVAALAVVSNVEEVATARQLATRIEGRLIRGRAVTLRVPAGPWTRVALAPACFGRDPGIEVSLRDPAVSRRHLLVRGNEVGLTVEDAGSRGGVRMGGARIERPLPLSGSGELTLGGTTVLRFRAGERTVLFEGATGLDRTLRALIGLEPVDLGELFPEAQGLSVALSGGGPRLVRRTDVAVRVDGHFIGPGCDLLHGDTIEVGGSAPIRLEVE